MRALAVVCLLATQAAADTRASSTTLTLTRGKAKPIRVLAKKIEVNVVRPLTPCVLQVVVEPQHPMFKRFTLEIGYQVSSNGAIKSSRGPINAEIVALGSTNPISTRRGQVEVTRRPQGAPSAQGPLAARSARTRGDHSGLGRKPHAFDAKLSAMFDHSSSQWTLSGLVKVEDAACMWDLE